jgi:hypothetical protein
MDILIEKLHTAARRYCIERYDYWQERYSYLPNDGRCSDEYHYSDEALDIFPRYLLLKAILIQIEGFLPQDFSTLTEAKTMITLGGLTAEDSYTKNASRGAVEKRVMEEERETFSNFVRLVSQEELSKIEPLFFRRVISTTESKQLWARLVEIWGVDKPHGVMYPIVPNNPKNALFLEEDFFKKEVGTEILRAILTEHGTKRVWELREFISDPEYELDVSVLEPYYNGAEGYWFTSEMDWIIYASHEGTITFNGWIIGATRKVLQR